MISIATVPSIASLSADIQAALNCESSIKHPLYYSAEWSGTRLPLLDVAVAVEHAKSMHATYNRKPQQYRWPMGRWPDPILRRSADPVDKSLFGSSTLRQACNILRNTAVAEGAVGLAAQQCGVNARIIYLDVPLFGHTKSCRFMINPQILNRSPEIDMIPWQESCLVLPPTFQATVLRDAWVDVSYDDLERNSENKKVASRHVVRLYGEMARAVQHEMDHDRGILVTDHVSLDEL